MSFEMARKVQVPMLNHRPVLLVSAPGMGKSMFTRWFALNFPRWFPGLPPAVHIEINLSQNEGIDVHGCRILSKETRELNGKQYTVTAQAPPDYALDSAQAATKGLPVLINYEEISCIPPSEAAPVHGILDSNVVGGIKLDFEHVGIIACCNPPHLSSGGWKISAPVMNRVCRLNFAQTVHEWADNFITYWNNPPKVKRWGSELPESEWASDRAMVASFAKQHPEVVNQMPKPGQKGIDGLPEEAFASFRSLDFVSRTKTRCRLNDVPDDERNELWAGDIGAAAALQLQQYVDHFDMPKPGDLIDDPSLFTADIPTDKIYACVMACVAEMLNRRRIADEKKNKKAHEWLIQSWQNMWIICQFILDQKGPKDIVAKAAHQLADPSVYPKGAEPPATVLEVAKIVRASNINWRKR